MTRLSLRWKSFHLSMLPIETDCCDFELRILEFVSVSAVWLVVAEWNRRDAENAEETQRVYL